MPNKIISTQFIVLKKTPYMESSLIISGISPFYGRIDLIIKGARKITRKSSPEVDLFRLFNIQFADKGKSLLSPLVIEYVRDFDKLAWNSIELGKILKEVPFILNNTHYGVPSRFLYETLIKHLERVVSGGKSYVWLVKLAYIYENGTLPHILTNSDSKEEEKSAQMFVNLLLKYANGSGGFPEVSDVYLHSFEVWINNMCQELRL